MKLMKKITAVALSAAMTMTMLTGCSGGSDSATTAAGGSNAASNTTAAASDTSGSSKTQLNVATELMSATLEPATNWDSWFVIRWGIGETLVKFGEDGSFEPWLADSWSVAEDKLTWTIQLKEGIKFSNGADMTASKVVASIERLYEKEDPANGGTGNPQVYMTYSSIKADDAANTVTIVTEEPTPDLPGCLAYPWMLIVDAEASESRDVNVEGPIATGPYMVDSVTQDSEIKLVKNEYYWDGDVPFETVDVLKVSEAATRAMALQDGSADIAINISSADRATLEADDSYSISVVSGSRLGYAHVNMAGVLGNDSLRQAVMMAIDGETIASVTANGSYEYGYSVISSSMDYGYDTLKYEFAYNPEQAKSVLDKAGIVDSDGDGYRELDGKNIEIDYKVTANRQMDLIAQAQATQLEEVGIKCNVQVVETNAEALNNKTFDLCSSNEVTSPTGDPGNFLSHWYSKSTDNYANYSNAEYDKIYEALQAEFDASKRRDYIIQLQQILLDDAAALVYGYYNFNLCSTSAVTGAYCPTSDYYWVNKDIKPAQ